MNTFKHYAIAGFVAVTLVGSLLNWKHRCAEMRALLAEAEAIDAAGARRESAPGSHGAAFRANWRGPLLAEAASPGGR